MKTMLSFLSMSLVACGPLTVPLVSADTLVLMSGRTVTGTVLQTNGDDLVVMTGGGTFSYSLSNMKEIKFEKAEAVTSTNRLPSAQELIAALSKQSWSAGLMQIPATVIDSGMLKNVPYVSFRCGDDYEVNIYGDLDNPAGIEAGIYRKLLDDPSAKENCLKLVGFLLRRGADKAVVQKLNLEKDLKTLEGLTFEITPPTAPDAYQGWWVSVYSEHELDLDRATAEELKKITIPKIAVESEDPLGWSAKELKLARPSAPERFTFRTAGGLMITNAEVKPYVGGVSIIWREGASGGVMRLADLPEDLRTRLGYDEAKTKAADAMEADKKARQLEQAQLIAAQYAQQAQDAQLHGYAADDNMSAAYISGGSYPRSNSRSSGGSVFVRSYTRSNGTTVQSYTRSAPGSGGGRHR